MTDHEQQASDRYDTLLAAKERELDVDAMTVAWSPQEKQAFLIHVAQRMPYLGEVLQDLMDIPLAERTLRREDIAAPDDDDEHVISASRVLDLWHGKPARQPTPPDIQALWTIEAEYDAFYDDEVIYRPVVEAIKYCYLALPPQTAISQPEIGGQRPEITGGEKPETAALLKKLFGDKPEDPQKGPSNGRG